MCDTARFATVFLLHTSILWLFYVGYVRGVFEIKGKSEPLSQASKVHILCVRAAPGEVWCCSNTLHAGALKKLFVGRSHPPHILCL